MNFEVLKRSHVKRNILIGVIIVLILSAIILTFTKAKYKITESLPLVNGTINYELSDFNLIGAYIQTEGDNYTQVNEIPTSGYEFNAEKSYCTVNNENINVTLSYDMETQNLTVTPLTTKGTKCYLYFDVKSDPATDVIEGIYEENQGILAYDNTVDNNLRYIGADPNNYVYFNCEDYNNPSNSTCELWRIIGIFNENSHGISGEKLIKLIRSDSLGNMAWNSDSDNNSWTESNVKTILNGDYLNGSGTYVSNGIKNDTTRNMIATVTWKLGSSTTYKDVTSNIFYERERGTTVYSGRPTTWQGKIALMYPSDYGYATSGGTTTNRNTCLAQALYNWNSSSFSDCKNNNWIYDNNKLLWTLTVSHGLRSIYTIFDTGFVVDNYDYGGAAATNHVLPSLYLSPEVSIIEGEGTINNPYTLQN